MSAPSKFAENQFLSATENSYSLMSEFLTDTVPRVSNATDGILEFIPVVTDFMAAAEAWHTGAMVLAVAEATIPGLTLAIEDKMASLTRRPDADTNSTLEDWDHILRGEVAYQGPAYTSLLPRGRETLTAGTRAEQIDALETFSRGLQGQTTKPVLVALAATVATFGNAARGLSDAQTEAKTELDTARTTQEPLRVDAGVTFYAVVGQSMALWCRTPDRVDTLFDINILRNPSQAVPEAPADTTWTPASRTLATTALPSAATRVEAWRVGPGGMPELLATGGTGETAIIIPATITFTPGGLYQLWLVALNSKGRSTAGPLQNWTAV